MNTINKWAERVYGETDFGRSVATSVSGIAGLLVYLVFSDWVIAAFSSIITFPIVRLISTGLYERATRRVKGRLAREEAERAYDQLSDDEKQVVLAFVEAGGCVLTWGQVNELLVSKASVESLIQRELLWTSVTVDGRETFVLDPAIFDVGQDRKRAISPRAV